MKEQGLFSKMYETKWVSTCVGHLIQIQGPGTDHEAEHARGHRIIIQRYTLTQPNRYPGF
jgi:hypothetical protein